MCKIRKRVLTILAILLLPLSVWAMTPVTDTDLSNVTGQAGVNINANVSMDIHIGTMAWGDSDGITGIYNPWTVPANSSGGYIGMANFNITDLTVTARMEATDNYNGYNTLMLKPITIDVATTNSAMTVTTTPSWGGSPITTESLGAGTTFVRFGLGALEISLDSLQFDIGLSARSSAAATAAIADSTLSQNLGEVTMGEMSIYINPWSYVDIYSADKQSDGGGSSGVRFAVNVTVDQFTLGYISWGDQNGFAELKVPTSSGQGIGNVTATDWMHDTAPGYIGLNKLSIGGPIAINGTVAIDINTSSNGIYSYLYSLLTSLSPAYPYFTNQHESNFTTWINRLIAAHRNMNNGDEVVTYIDTYIQIMYGPELDMHYNQQSVTVVHVSFPTDFLVDVTGPITAAVDLSPNATLTGTGTATLGDIYISRFGLDIHSGSWVDIWAH